VQHAQVDRVHLDFVPLVILFRLRRFQMRAETVPARIVDEVGKTFPADISFPNMRVTVFARAELVDAVVKV